MARGAPVRSSKNGVGRASPLTHQPSIFDVRQPKTRSDGGGGAFSGSSPTAERSKMRQSGAPSTSFRERLSASCSMNEWITATTGKCGPAGIADRGPATRAVPAQDRAGEAEAPHGVRARGELHARGWHLDVVRPAGRVEHVHTPEETGEHLAVLAVADESEAGGRGNAAGDAAHAAASAPKWEVQGHVLLRTEHCRIGGNLHYVQVERYRMT
jgi:hypothetical protein